MFLLVVVKGNCPAIVRQFSQRLVCLSSLNLPIYRRKFFFTYEVGKHEQSEIEIKSKID